MKQLYERTVLEIIQIDSEDIIVTSESSNPYETPLA